MWVALRRMRQGGRSITADIIRYHLGLVGAKAGRGQGLVEYVLISIVAIAIMTTLGASITSIFSTANSSLTAP